MILHFVQLQCVIYIILSLLYAVLEYIGEWYFLSELASH